jgi:hypothetical protein
MSEQALEITVAKIDLNDLSDAMTLSDDPTSEAWVNLITGAIHIRSDLIGRDDLPDDIETSDDYIAVPSTRSLDLGHAVVCAFAEAELPLHAQQVREICRKKGAYAAFSRLVDACNARDKWHKFRDEHTEKALRDWCLDNGLEPK